MTNTVDSEPRKHSLLLYRTIWRWHFYAGLFCLPFVLMLAVSGTIYLFKPQIDARIDRPYHSQETAGQRASANAQIAAALAAVPGGRFAYYRLPENDAQAVIIGINREDRQMLVYVHPYTLEVLKTVDYDNQFIRVVRSFHGELLAGTPGSLLVELAGSWAIVLIITGLYLWWPRSARGVAGVLYPRLRQGNRTFWRDMHAVTGFWISGFTLFLLISGLPWTLFWGNALKELRQLNDAPQQQDWTLSRAQEKADRVSDGVNTIDLNPRLLATAQSLNFAPPVELAVSRKNAAVWTVKSDHQNRRLRANAWLDGQTGEVLRMKTFAELNTLDKIIGIGVSAHEGQLFGWPNQLLALITTSGLIAMTVSGFVLWRKRKPAGVLGAPPAIPNAATGKIVTGIVFALSLLLPLLAASLVTLLLLEWLVLRRIRPARRWLGLYNT